MSAKQINKYTRFDFIVEPLRRKIQERGRKGVRKVNNIVLPKTKTSTSTLSECLHVSTSIYSTLVFFLMSLGVRQNRVMMETLFGEKRSFDL
jgi:hypothetical protein